MILNRAKIPATIVTHEQLIVWTAFCLRFNTTTLTFVRKADEEPSRFADAGIFRDAAGVDRVGVIVYPPLNPLWMASATKPWESVTILSESAQAANFDS